MHIFHCPDIYCSKVSIGRATMDYKEKIIELLDKGVTIEQVNGIKTLFTVSPADGSYKVNFGEEEFMNYFKAFLRPQLVEMLF